MYDITKVLEVLDTVVEKRGADYIYPRLDLEVDGQEDGFDCHYIWTEDDRRRGLALSLDLQVGQPACLVGALLDEMGLLDPYVRFVQDANDHGVAALELEEVFDTETMDVLDRVQAIQDKGETWGQARDTAHRHAALLRAYA